MNNTSIRQRLREEFFEFNLLLKSVPQIITLLFVVSVISMNLLANKSVSLPVSWLAVDCGLLASWFSFLTMDIITRHFGPKAATELSVLAVGFNLLVCLILFVGSIIPGNWGESYVEGSQDIINTALNNTFGGTWFVLAGSTIAFLISSVVNNFSNWGIGKILRSSDDRFLTYAIRSYFSTALGQFVDNLVFALIVSHTFFGWTLIQCITCAVTGMLVETLCEILFSGFGYRLLCKWRDNDVGEEYLSYISEGDKEVL